MSELKPCPFCGNEDVEIALFNIGWPKAWWVHCEKCKSDGAWAPEEQKAIQKWNTRVEKVCRWAPNTRIGFGWTDDDYWETGCGTAFTVIDHLPLLDKEFLYCPKCGGKIEVVD